MTTTPTPERSACGSSRAIRTTSRTRTGFYPDLSGAKTYFFHVSWGNGRVQCVIRENGPQGALVLNQGINYQGTYAPDPHVVHIGVPVPRGGPADATVPGIIVRYFHVSDGRPWPGGTGAAVAASTTASR